jgi:hypothetical protein
MIYQTSDASFFVFCHRRLVVIFHLGYDVNRRVGGPGPLSTRERILTVGRAG